MPLTGEGRNEQGNATARGTAPSVFAAFVTFGITSDTTTLGTETAATGKKFKAPAHGLETNDVVVFTELNGKIVLGETVGGLVVGVPYWVFKISAEEFSIANTKAQASAEATCIEYTAAIKVTTKFAEVEEHTGAKTKRKKTKFELAANGVNEDTEAHEVEASGAAVALWAMYWSAETVGTLIAVEAVTSKTLAEADIWKLNAGATISQTGYLV